MSDPKEREEPPREPNTKKGREPNTGGQEPEREPNTKT